MVILYAMEREKKERITLQQRIIFYEYLTKFNGCSWISVELR